MRIIRKLPVNLARLIAVFLLVIDLLFTSVGDFHPFFFMPRSHPFSLVTDHTMEDSPYPHARPISTIFPSPLLLPHSPINLPLFTPKISQEHNHHPSNNADEASSLPSVTKVEGHIEQLLRNPLLYLSCHTDRLAWRAGQSGTASMMHHVDFE